MSLRDVSPLSTISTNMAEFRSDKKHDFDLEVVLDAFRKCILPDGSLSLDEYLRAFHELCR